MPAFLRFCIGLSLVTFNFSPPSWSSTPAGSGENQNSPAGLTLIAVGDAGGNNGVYRANAFYISDMFTGRHDAGKPDMLFFLGDNFLPFGLNVPLNDVEGMEKDLVRPVNEVIGPLPPSRVHAIPGEHDYYTRFAEEQSSFFGLIKSGEGPTGLSDRGNIREAEFGAWTYHHGVPGDAVVPLFDGSTDSVQFFFFDSAILLRTDASRWHPALDRLRGILGQSKGRSRIAWRVLCAHHPWYSVGVHGGYSVWNDETNSVDYLTNCDRDSNAAGFVRNWLEPVDLCAGRYMQYIDSVKSVVAASGVKIQIMLSAHDRSLQLLYYPDNDPGCAACPHVHIISGAGSLPERVKTPSPPRDYTSSGRNPADQAVSRPGFVQLRFDSERVRVVFFDAMNGNPIDMGEGRTAFWIDREGGLTSSEASR